MKQFYYQKPSNQYLVVKRSIFGNAKQTTMFWMCYRLHGCFCLWSQIHTRAWIFALRAKYKKQQCDTQTECNIPNVVYVSLTPLSFRIIQLTKYNVYKVLPSASHTISSELTWFPIIYNVFYGSSTVTAQLQPPRAGDCGWLLTLRRCGLVRRDSARGEGNYSRRTGQSEFSTLYAEDVAVGAGQA